MEDYLFAIQQDVDMDIGFQWFESDGETPCAFSEPVAVVSELRVKPVSEEALLKLSSADGTISVYPEIAKITLHYKAELTKGLDFNTASIDILVKETVGGEIRKTRDVRGTVKLIRMITRDE
jgi:hypothetical protein